MYNAAFDLLTATINFNLLQSKQILLSQRKSLRINFNVSVSILAHAFLLSRGEGGEKRKIEKKLKIENERVMTLFRIVGETIDMVIE